MVSAAPRAFVVGHPIAHSRSPLVHGFWLRSHGLAGSYERVDVAPDAFADFLRGLAENGFVGGNVTLPHKESAFRLVDAATPHAERLGAVNTVWFEGGRLLGDNTDGQGFAGSLDETLGAGWPTVIRTALVIGAGGAARAIVPALLDRGVGRVLVANRSGERAEALAEAMPDRVVPLPWEGLAGALPGADLLVNTTQLGMKGQPSLALDLSGLPGDAVVADAVYVPLETPLLAAARRRGLRTVDGLGMLLHQAVPGFARWFGVTPAVTPELRQLVAADIAGSP